MHIVIHVCDTPLDAARRAGELEGRDFQTERIVTLTVPSRTPPTFRSRSMGADRVEVRNDTNPNHEIHVVVGLRP